MFIHRLGNAFDKARAALRFARIVQRRMGIADDASAPGPVSEELMQDAYAEAVAEIASANRGFGRPGGSSDTGVATRTAPEAGRIESAHFP